MSTQTLEVGRPLVRPRTRGRMWRGGLQGSEFTWAIAFTVPYIALFLAFVAYPVVFGAWLGHKPSLYVELAEDPIFQQAIVNTILYVGIAVNLKMFGALLLSGFFMRRGWWVKALLLVFVLPWAMPALPAFISIHWMLNGEWGLFNNFLWTVVRHQRAGLARHLALAGARRRHLFAHLEVDAVLDGDPAGRPHGDPAGPLRGGRGRRRHGPDAVHPRHLPAARQSLPRVHAALDDLHPGRLQLGVFRLGRRAGAVHPRAGHARHP